MKNKVKHIFLYKNIYRKNNEKLESSKMLESDEETDTTVGCGYDSQGFATSKKVTVAGTGNTFDCIMKIVRAGRKREV